METIVSKDEYLEYTGVDLSSELSQEGSGNPSNRVNAFIFRCQERLRAFVRTNYAFDLMDKYRRLNAKQIEEVKLAVMEQITYTLRNGDISSDSGYDPETGVKAGINELRDITIAPNAKEHLMLAGLLTRHIEDPLRGIYGIWR